MDVVEHFRNTDGFYFSPDLQIRQLENRGNSVVCTKDIPAGELLIKVPLSMLLTRSSKQGSKTDSKSSRSNSFNTSSRIDTTQSDKSKNLSSFTDSSISKKNGGAVTTSTASTASTATSDGLDTHEELALMVLEKRKSRKDPWISSFPDDFDTMCYFWPDSEWKKLPSLYKSKVVAQKEYVENFARKANLSLKDAAWAWASVNTRCLYWNEGGMALVPVIDYLNHTCDKADGLDVGSNAQGFYAKTQRSYKAGEEVSFCYGPHENACLMVHYGFYVEDNPWDFVSLDDGVTSDLMAYKNTLIDEGLWLNWTLDLDGAPDFLTEIALTVCDSTKDLRQAMKMGLVKPGQFIGGRLQAIVMNLIHMYSEYVDSRNPFLAQYFGRMLYILDKASGY